MEPTNEARKKGFATVRYHIIRIVLFVSACVCAVTGMLLLSFTSDKQTRAETVASEVTRSDAQAQVLLIMSYDDSDVLTPLARNGVVGIMNNSSVAVDVEYMDAIHNPKGSEAYEAWSDALAAKMGSDTKYNAIICADDDKEAKTKQYLRSRISVEYNIRHCNVDPFASFELSNSLDHKFSIDKRRWTLGADWKITKKHTVTVAYVYTNGQDDDDEGNLHALSIGYNYKF